MYKHAKLDICFLQEQFLQYYTVNDKSYVREKLREFLMNCESFPTNDLSNGSNFNTDEAKTAKVFPTFG